MENDGSAAVLVIVQLALPFAVLILAFLVGRHLENQHIESIRQRERKTKGLPTLTLTEPPSDMEVVESQLIYGSVVISVDYFKRFLSALRSIIGGEIKSYTPLLDRARREAILRMKEEAIRRGYHAVINVRLETSRLANGRRDGKGTAGVEMLAFGTGLKRAHTEGGG